MANLGRQYVSSRSAPNFGQKKSKKEQRKFPQPGHNDIAPSATTDLSDYRQPQPGAMIANVIKSLSTSKSSSPPNYMVGKQLQAPRRNTEIAIPNPQTQLKAPPRPSFPVAGVVQPKLTIGRPNDLYGQGFEPIATQEVQLKADTLGSTPQPQAQLQQHPSSETLSILGGDRSLHGKGEMTGNSQVSSEVSRPNKTGLPDRLKTGIENLSGYSMDDVKVHYNSDKPARLQAHAYAQGTDIHLGPRQEKHLPHEAWHVVQQKQGRVRPTMQMKGGVNINDDAGLEKEADVMGAKAMQMKPKENKSRAVANSVVQKKNNGDSSGRYRDNQKEINRAGNVIQRTNNSIGYKAKSLGNRPNRSEIKNHVPGHVIQLQPRKMGLEIELTTKEELEAYAISDKSNMVDGMIFNQEILPAPEETPQNLTKKDVLNYQKTQAFGPLNKEYISMDPDGKKILELQLLGHLKDNGLSREELTKHMGELIKYAEVLVSNAPCYVRGKKDGYRNIVLKISDLKLVESTPQISSTNEEPEALDFVDKNQHNLINELSSESDQQAISQIKGKFDNFEREWTKSAGADAKDLIKKTIQFMFVDVLAIYSTSKLNILAPDDAIKWNENAPAITRQMEIWNSKNYNSGASPGAKSQYKFLLRSARGNVVSSLVISNGNFKNEKLKKIKEDGITLSKNVWNDRKWSDVLIKNIIFTYLRKPMLNEEQNASLIEDLTARSVGIIRSKEDLGKDSEIVFENRSAGFKIKMDNFDPKEFAKQIKPLYFENDEEVKYFDSESYNIQEFNITDKQSENSSQDGLSNFDLEALPPQRYLDYENETYVKENYEWFKLNASIEDNVIEKIKVTDQELLMKLNQCISDEEEIDQNSNLTYLNFENLKEFDFQQNTSVSKKSD